MSANIKTRGNYPFYRCTSVDCERRMTISAPVVERLVVDAVQEAVRGVYGLWDQASANARTAQLELNRAQNELDAAIRVLADFTDEQATRDRLSELRQIRDDAQTRVDRIGGPRRVKLTLTTDWERMSLDEKRDLIRALVERVDVMPGRGPDRVSITMLQ